MLNPFLEVELARLCREEFMREAAISRLLKRERATPVVSSPRKLVLAFSLAALVITILLFLV